MRKTWPIWLLTLLVLFASCKQQGQSSDNLQPLLEIVPDTSVSPNFVDTALGFAAWFPQQPLKSEEPFDLGQHSAVLHTFYVDYIDSMFVLSVMIYPEDFQVDAPGQFLRQLHQRANENMGVFQTVEKLDSISPTYARLLFRGVSGRFHIVGLNALYGRSYYQLMIVKTDQYPSQQTINRFLGSFKILNAEKTIEQ